MRTIVLRRLGALASLLSCTLLASSAHASDVVERAGKPWITTRTSAASPDLRSVASIEASARRELTTVSVSAARLGTSLVRTGLDRFGDGDVVVRFEQSHLGLPVIGRGATVRLGRAGRAVSTVDVEESLPASAIPSVPASAAAAVAQPHSPVVTTADDAHLAVWPTRQGGRLAWIVLPRTTGLPTAPRIVVDAVTGRVLEARDTVVFAKAQVYRTNPVKSPTLELLDLPIEATGPNLTSDFVDAVNCIDNKAVRPVKFYGFNQDVRTCDLQKTALPNETGDFVATPTDVPGSIEAKSDTFSEVSIYFHASKAYAFFRELQGDPAAQVTDDKPLRAVANLQLPPGVSSGNFASAGDPSKPLEPFSNAFFSPASGGSGDLFAQLYNYKGGALWFGQGPQRDYAYDGDVVYHEFTHAVVDHTLRLGQWTADERGLVDAPGAMNEGLADYFSSAIAGDPDVGEYASKDLSQNLTVIRTLANKDACPGAILGEVHFDSTLFSGGLWSARTALATDDDRKKLDAAFYKAMRTNPGRSDLGYEDMVNLFLATLATDFPAGAEALKAAMTARGVLPGCERILAFEGKTLAAGDPRLGYQSPSGASIGLGGTAPGILQIKAKLPAYTSKVKLTFTAKESQRGGGGFGGGGGTYQPVVLVKFGKPITWKEGSAGLDHDADAKKKVDGGSGDRTIEIDVPDTANATDSEVYFQIANNGDVDGSYDQVAIETVAGTPPVGDTPPADPAATPAASPTQTDSGCACSTPGTASGAGAQASAALGLLGIGAVLRLRRRR